MSKVVVGGGQGFWGDSNDAAIHMVRNSNIDYMACDYLAELTLSIMQRQKLRNPKAGFARDFVGLIQEIGEEAYRKNIGIISNAGGMNIESLVNSISQFAEENNLKGYKIGYVLGDDLTEKISELQSQGVTFENIDGIGDFNEIKDKIVNANVYYGTNQ